MVIQNWADVIVSSLQNLWVQVLGWLPSFIGAVVVFIIGVLVAAGLASLVEKVIAAIKLDELLKKLGFEEVTKRAGVELNSGHFLGRIVYWFLVLAFLLASSDILGFFGFSSFLQSVLLYVPNLIIAVLIMVASVVVANILRHLVRASILSVKVHGAQFLGSGVWWVVVVFGGLTALVQLGVATTIINTAITGIIAMLALAGGLAFGLGGRDYAAELLRRLQKEVEGK